MYIPVRGGWGEGVCSGWVDGGAWAEKRAAEDTKGPPVCPALFMLLCV